MKILACLDDPTPSSGECVSTAWVNLPSGFFDAWTTSDLGLLAGAVVTVWAVLLIFRSLHRWVQSDLNI